MLTKKQKKGIIIGIGALFLASAVVFLVIEFRKKMKEKEDKDILNRFPKLRNLHPVAQKYFICFFRKLLENGYTPIITSDYRDFYDVTQPTSGLPVASQGYSYHNYGMALDINLQNFNTNQYMSSASSSAIWKKITPIAQSCNIHHGIDFSDIIHFDLRTLYDINVLHNKFVSSQTFISQENGHTYVNI